jgi:trehalose 6-phosphate phosphatase
VLDIAAAPMSVSTPHDLTGTLRRLQRLLGGAVAILTGRKVDDVDRLLAPLKLIAAGVHGGEFRLEPYGEIEVAYDPIPEPILAAVERLARSVPGVIVERKGISVAMHYRAVPMMEPVLARELHDLLASHSNRMVLSHGRRVIELMAGSWTKGTALKRLMETPRFRGRQPLMIGDDSPDEAALETAARLGGLGLKVKGEHFKGGAIDFRDPAHVRRWLYDLAERLDT